MNKSALAIAAPLLAMGLLLVNSCQSTEEQFKPTYRNLTAAVYGTVTVEPVGLYSIYAPVNGIIETSYLNEGATVQQGDLLIKIDHQQLTLNEATAQVNYELAQETYQGETTLLNELGEGLAAARTKLLNDSLNYVRQARLWEQNIGSQQQLEARKLSFEMSQNEVRRLANNLLRTEEELARKVDIARNNRAITSAQREDFLVHSRMAGTIYEVYKEVGESVNPQAPIALIGSTDSFVVKLLIDEIDIAAVQAGQTALISLDAYPDQVFPATVQQILPTKDARSQTFTLEARFDRRPPRLYNGLSGEANIVIEEREAILTLPKALVREDLTVRTQEGYVSIEPGLSDLQYVEIVSGIDSTTIILQPE